MITRQSPSWVIYSILRYDEGGKQRRARKQIWRNKPHVGFRLTWDLLEVGTEDPLPPLWFIRNGVQGPHLLITLAGGGVGGLEPPVLLVSQKWTHKNCGIWVGVEVCVWGGGVFIPRPIPRNLFKLHYISLFSYMICAKRRQDHDSNRLPSSHGVLSWDKVKN